MNLAHRHVGRLVKIRLVKTNVTRTSSRKNCAIPDTLLSSVWLTERNEYPLSKTVKHIQWHISCILWYFVVLFVFNATRRRIRRKWQLRNLKPVTTTDDLRRDFLSLLLLVAKRETPRNVRAYCSVNQEKHKATFSINATESGLQVYTSENSRAVRKEKDKTPRTFERSSFADICSATGGLQ